MTYELLENSLTDSTLWMRRSDPARILAITIISKCNGSDRVYVPAAILIERARLSPDVGAKALVELMQPDPESRCRLEDGRFVVEGVDEDGNRFLWLPSYAGRRRKYLARERKRAERERLADVSRPVTLRHDESRSVTSSHDPSREEQNRAEQNRTEQNREEKTHMAEPGNFALFWTAYPRKVKRPKALLAWKRLSDSDRAAILEILPTWPFDHKDQGRFIPYPEAWLHGRRWEDAPDPLSPLPVGSHGKAPVEMYANTRPLTDEEAAVNMAAAEAAVAAAYRKPAP